MSNLKFKYFQDCDNAKKTTNVAYFDGYAFGDTLLEGVWFKATIHPRGRLSVSVCEKYRPYFRTLNQRQWLKAACDYAEDCDLFAKNPEGDLVLELIPEKGNQQPGSGAPYRIRRSEPLT